MVRHTAVKLSDAQYADLFQTALAAGQAAAEATTPTPVVFYSPKDVFSAGGNFPFDADMTQPVYHEADGVCGFGWVEIRPSRGGIASWMKANGKGRYSEYDRCHRFSSPLRTQSLARNEAFANGFAKVLRDAGIAASGCSRID